MDEFRYGDQTISTEDNMISEVFGPDKRNVTLELRRTFDSGVPVREQSFSWYGTGSDNYLFGLQTQDILTMKLDGKHVICLLYTSPSPRDGLLSRMPSSA